MVIVICERRRDVSVLREFAGPTRARMQRISEQRGGLPDTAMLAPLGCGKPTAVADLNDGERVLDLGSGAGVPRARE
jgi:hypothetical protein